MMLNQANCCRQSLLCRTVCVRRRLALAERHEFDGHLRLPRSGPDLPRGSISIAHNPNRTTPSATGEPFVGGAGASAGFGLASWADRTTTWAGPSGATRVTLRRAGPVGEN